MPSKIEADSIDEEIRPKQQCKIAAVLLVVALVVAVVCVYAAVSDNPFDTLFYKYTDLDKTFGHLARFEDTWSGFACSCAVIHPKWCIMAAHCLERFLVKNVSEMIEPKKGTTKPKLDFKRMTLLFTRDGTDKVSRSYNVSKVITPALADVWKLATHQDLPPDVALVQIEHSAEFPVNPTLITNTSTLITRKRVPCNFVGWQGWRYSLIRPTIEKLWKTQLDVEVAPIGECGFQNAKFTEWHLCGKVSKSERFGFCEAGDPGSFIYCGQHPKRTLSAILLSGPFTCRIKENKRNVLLGDLFAYKSWISDILNNRVGDSNWIFQP